MSFVLEVSKTRNTDSVGILETSHYKRALWSNLPTCTITRLPCPNDEEQAECAIAAINDATSGNLVEPRAFPTSHKQPCCTVTRPALLDNNDELTLCTEDRTAITSAGLRQIVSLDVMFTEDRTAVLPVVGGLREMVGNNDATAVNDLLSETVLIEAGARKCSSDCKRRGPYKQQDSESKKRL